MIITGIMLVRRKCLFKTIPYMHVLAMNKLAYIFTLLDTEYVLNYKKEWYVPMCPHIKLANTPQTVIDKESTGTIISGVKTEV
jgi:hypothetical protein